MSTYTQYNSPMQYSESVGGGGGEGVYVRVECECVSPGNVGEVVGSSSDGLLPLAEAQQS